MKERRRDWEQEYTRAARGCRRENERSHTLFRFPSNLAYSSSTSCSSDVSVSDGEGAEFCDVERACWSGTSVAIVSISCPNERLRREDQVCGTLSRKLPAISRGEQRRTAVFAKLTEVSYEPGRIR